MTRRPVNCTAVSLKAKLEGSRRYVLVGRDFYIEDGADKDFLSRLCGLPLYHLSGARAADYLPAIKRAIRLLEADPAAYASPLIYEGEVRATARALRALADAIRDCPTAVFEVYDVRPMYEEKPCRSPCKKF